MMKDLVVLKRTMFSEKLPKSVRNSGIMAGFEDDDMLEAPEKEDEMPVMARTPQNPEILMNNLRGDMRSVDARYQELAQMVGDEAAMETPPEVLAMLQMQFGQQQEGIGALPQGAEMMPPPMGGGAPMGAPGGAPAMPSPQGAMPPQGMPAMPSQGAMPLGMEGAGPFPQGGAEQAPQQFNKGGLARRRGDDLRPLEGGGGSGGGGYSSPGFSSAAARPPPLQITPAGQAFLAKPPSMSVRDYLSDKAGKVSDFMGGFLRPAQFETRTIADLNKSLGYLNKSLGYRFMAPQPTVSRVTGGTPPMNLSVQGRNTLVKDPATGMIVPGKGTQFAPFTAMGPLRSPTFTQGVVQGVNRLVVEYPRVAALLPPALLTAAGIAGINLTEEQRSTPLTPEEQAKYDETMAQIDAVNRPSPPVLSSNQLTPQEIERFVTQSAPAVEEEVVAKDDTTGDTTSDFIEKNLVQPKKLSRIERIKAAQSEYDPLFKELLGDTKQDARTNAFLLLADAGFKLASTYKPTFAMAASEAAKDIPRGLAAIAAQQKDRDVKVKTAALTQAITDITTQDAAEAARQLKVLEGDYKLLAKQVDQGGIIVEDGGLGGRITKTKSGSFTGFGIDPKDPAVTSAINSRFTLRDTDNPFVQNRGQAPTTIETNKDERIKLGNTLRSLDNSLSTLDNLKGVYTSAYGPRTWFLDKVNNLLIPVIPTGLIKPDFDTTDAATRISTGMNRLLKDIASANDSGRVAVQEQEWVRETAKGISNPTAFFSDKELAAKQFGSTEAMLRNARQQVLTQLGYEGNDYVMNTPSTGTENDPFRISTDPAEQQIMYKFLGDTVGKLQDPEAFVHLRMPNGQVQQFTPIQLRALNQ
jgi:hypothetical protein